MANHLTRPMWVTAESERKIVQLNGATGTTLQKEPIGTCNDPHICVPLHDIYIILFAPVAIHAFNNLYWYILSPNINICSIIKKPICYHTFGTFQALVVVMSLLE